MRGDSGRFLNVLMDQNNKCNLRCVMCGFSDPRVRDIPKYDMPFWLFEKIAREVFPRAKYLALSCLTEPLMTKDFPQRLDLLKVYTVPFTDIITNGILLNETVILKLIDAGVSRLALSIDGADPATYESVRIGAKFDKLTDNIKMFNRIKKQTRSELPKLRMNHVISGLNIDRFREFLDFAESMEVQAIDVRTIIPFQNVGYRQDDEDSFFQKIELIREDLRLWTLRTGVEDAGYLRHKPEEISMEDDAGRRMTCRRPWDTVAIHANGDVLPCITWTRQPCGNMAAETFEDIWNGSVYNAIRAEFEERKPGVDCLYCSMKKKDVEVEDDCYFDMLNKRPPKRPFAVMFAELAGKILAGCGLRH
jgi:radical SAM protein with 4Fe4S-binding SPASM domain